MNGGEEQGLTLQQSVLNMRGRKSCQLQVLKNGGGSRVS